MNEAAAHGTPVALDQSSRGLPIWSPRGRGASSSSSRPGTCRLAGSNGVCVALAKAVGAGVDDGRGRQARVMVAIARDVPREAQTVECGGRRGASGQWWSVDFYYSYSRGRMVTHARARFLFIEGYRVY